LQLGVLIEQMRREGFELTIGRPRVLTRDNPETGEREEPFEEVPGRRGRGLFRRRRREDVLRKGQMQDMRPSGGGKVRLTFHIPSRGLIGYHGEFLTDTRGTGMMNRCSSAISPGPGRSRAAATAALISNATARRSSTRCSTCRSAARCS
jgi:GTP-binding protein